jgi:hypothetical protein
MDEAASEMNLMFALTALVADGIKETISLTKWNIDTINNTGPVAYVAEHSTRKSILSVQHACASNADHV